VPPGLTREGKTEVVAVGFCSNPKSAFATFPLFVLTANIPLTEPSFPIPVPIFSPVDTQLEGYVAEESVVPAVCDPLVRIRL
jgi:hypothetical protein